MFTIDDHTRRMLCVCLFVFVWRIFNFATSLSLCYLFMFFQLPGCAVASDVADPFCASGFSALSEVGVLSEIQQRLVIAPYSALSALVKLDLPVIATAASPEVFTFEFFNNCYIRMFTIDEHIRRMLCVYASLEFRCLFVFV